MKAVLAAAGAKMDDVVKITMIIKTVRISQRSAVSARIFSESLIRPARPLLHHYLTQIGWWKSRPWLLLQLDRLCGRRQLAEAAEDPSIKQELLDLAAVCEEAADNIEDRMPGVTLAMREALLGRGHLPVRDRRAYNRAQLFSRNWNASTLCASHEF